MAFCDDLGPLDSLHILEPFQSPPLLFFDVFYFSYKRIKVPKLLKVLVSCLLTHVIRAPILGQREAKINRVIVEYTIASAPSQQIQLHGDTLQT